MYIWVATTGTDGEPGTVQGAYYTLEDAQKALYNNLKRDLPHKRIDGPDIDYGPDNDDLAYLLYDCHRVWKLERFKLTQE